MTYSYLQDLQFTREVMMKDYFDMLSFSDISYSILVGSVGIVGTMVLIFRFFRKLSKKTSSMMIDDVAEFNGIDPRMDEAGRILRREIGEPQQ